MYQAYGISYAEAAMGYLGLKWSRITFDLPVPGDYTRLGRMIEVMEEVSRLLAQAEWRADAGQRWRSHPHNPIWSNSAPTD